MNLNRFDLKLLLVLAMFTAHLSFLIDAKYINYLLFFWVAPAFGSIVAFNSIFHSRDCKAYAKKIFIFALISQPYFLLFFGFPWYVPNVLFGLSIIPLLVDHMGKSGSQKSIIPSCFFYWFYPVHLAVLSFFKYDIFSKLWATLPNA